MRRSIIALVCIAVALGVGTQAATAASRFVAPGGSDAGNNCEDQWARCATIQHAIDEAGAGDGVDVAAGDYAENLTIDKPLELVSQAGVPTHWYEPETRVDGGSGTAIRVESNNVRIAGFDVATAGTVPAILVSGATADELRVEQNAISGGSAGVRLEAGGDQDRIGYNVIEGAGDGIRLSGAKYSRLEINWNRFVAPVDEYAVLADSTGTIEGFRLEGNEMPAPARIAARVEEGQSEESGIYENSFESTAGPQLAIDAAQVRIMRNSFDGHGSAGCLQVLGSQGGLLPSEDVLVSIENEFLDCDPYGIEVGPEVDDVSIYDAEFPGSYDGVLVSGASPWDVTEHVRIEDNRIVGTTHLGVENQASGILDAERNWWGCNAGPGAQGCDAASSGVNAEDNITLSALVGPRKKETGIIELPRGNSITLNPGEEAEVAAVLITNGEGIVLGGSTKEVPVGFASSLGTLSPSTSTFQNGWTRSFFTAGSTPGQGSIVVSLDNQRTLVPVTICCKPLETPPPPATSTPPAPKLVGPGKHILVASHRVTIGLVTCTTACRATPGRGQVVIGDRHYPTKVTPHGALGAEATVPIRVALPPAALQALKKVGQGSVKVTISVTDSAGQVSRLTISVKLRA
jgi:hypothetical protein